MIIVYIYIFDSPHSSSSTVTDLRGILAFCFGITQQWKMGITGKLVRTVFSRNRSVQTQESNEIRRSSAAIGDKRRWSTVRLHLCSDEFDSVLAEEDSASVKSSEATVTQPILQGSADVDAQSEEDSKESIEKGKHNSTSTLFRREDAAIVIQSAFRNFLATRRSKEALLKDSKPEQNPRTESPASDHILETKSPSRDSIGTSVEVQTGNSTGVLSIREEDVAIHHHMQKKARARVVRLKEDWDDSTVSSNISKMRIRNKQEAMNRRERALAYAFSQQLRICSSKKQTKSYGTQPSMSWSWLERWMATRVSECSVESCTGNEHEPTKSDHRVKKFSDVAVEERESCGSNEVSFQFDTSLMSSTNDKYMFRPAKRTISRRKTVPSHQLPKEQAKVIKRECLKETEQEAEHKPKQNKETK